MSSNKAQQEVSEEEFKARYSPDRIRKFLVGEMSGREFNELTGPQMLKLAVMGFTQYEQGRYPEAQAIFESLVFLDPKEAYYQIALGAVFLAQEDLELAEKALSVAIALNTTEVAAFVNRGEVYLRTGRIVLAAKDFKRAVELDPQGKEPLTQRARMLAGAALQMLKKAKAKKMAAAAASPGAEAKPAQAKPAQAGAKPAAKPAAPAAKGGAAKPAPTAQASAAKKK